LAIVFYGMCERDDCDEMVAAPHITTARAMLKEHEEEHVR
jgi:hypothetical protein